MSIDLNILLSRNKIRLSTFCKEMSILTYDALVLHCKARDIIVCSEKQWIDQVRPLVNVKTHTPEKNSNTAKTTKSKTTTNAAKKSTRTSTRRKTTKASPAQKKK